jgi:guanylate kinase
VGDRTRPRLIVVSGPSGVGKTTVVRALLRDPRYARAVTATTRPPRHGEADGVDYHFLTPEAFRAGIARGGFLEHAEVYGHLYGTPRSEPARLRAAGRHCILTVDVQGVRSIRALGLDADTVFLEAPSREELRRRLGARGLDDPVVVAARLAEAEAERAEPYSFDVDLVNDDVERTARRLAEALGLDWTPRPDAPAGAAPDRKEIDHGREDPHHR